MEGDEQEMGVTVCRTFKSILKLRVGKPKPGTGSMSVIKYCPRQARHGLCRWVPGSCVCVWSERDSECPPGPLERDHPVRLHTIPASLPPQELLRNKIQPSVGLESMMPGEVSQSEEDKCHMVSLICGI